MNAFWSVVARIGLALVSALPVERVAAALLDRLVQKTDGANIDKARATAAHLAELAELFGDVLADKQVTEIEVAAMKTTVMRARELLLENWADGRSAKTLQTELAKTGLTASYAQLAQGVGNAGA